MIRDLAQVRLIGFPLLSVEFVGLPSVNTHYGKHFRPRGIETAEWRYEAREKALTVVDELLGWESEGHVLIKKRALVVVRVFPPFEEISDIHNVFIKAALDGFTDAGVWADDEWASVPLVMHMFAGLGDQKPGAIKTRRTIIDVYELGSLTINGEKHRLPKGRSRNENNKETTPASNKGAVRKGQSTKKGRPRTATKGSKRRKAG